MTQEEIESQLQATRAQIQSLETGQPSTLPTGAEAWWSVTNAMTISAIVLVFGLIVLLLATYLIKAGKSSEAVLRIFGTVLILLMSVFLVVAGYTSNQIAPVIGLLGTIAGYLLGKETKP